MSKVKVEIIVAAGDHGSNLQATRQGDILAIQPAGIKWGRGDLTGNFMLVCELDLPCGSKFMVKKRCSACEHQGIAWKDDPVVEGTKGVPRTTCPVQKYMAADVIYTMMFDIHKIPYVEDDLSHGHGSKVDFLEISTISDETVNLVKAELLLAGMISDNEKNSRIVTAREASNEITSSKLKVKI